ncbi:four helix bundle protein [Persicirhabdus sediminis]|uniref:Four helix bundle protein n=1 Tax=Persicirhabdus sediminis TaxID=454144 RepID=A0A8J7ME60_9BACT|nr:four helix bundle protein [Persicirhabdus sediminis]MBK1791032.1 four helix bundle protein [Persicirhabdus sediminis]
MNAQPQGLCERSFDFAARIVNLCSKLQKTAGISRTLADQLLRSGTSIGANIEEAQASQSRKDYRAKMYIACKESRETNYWLRLLIKCNLIPESQLKDLLEESSQMIAILTTIVKKLND